MVRYRRVTEGGVPPAEKDPGIAEALSDLAGRNMLDMELVRDLSGFLHFSGWSDDYCFGLACNIAFANLEEPDQLSYLDKPDVSSYWRIQHSKNRRPSRRCVKVVRLPGQNGTMPSFARILSISFFAVAVSALGAH